jgi:hypothetical protein
LIPSGALLACATQGRDTAHVLGAAASVLSPPALLFGPGRARIYQTGGAKAFRAGPEYRICIGRAVSEAAHPHLPEPWELATTSPGAIHSRERNMSRKHVYVIQGVREYTAKAGVCRVPIQRRSAQVFFLGERMYFGCETSP